MESSPLPTLYIKQGFPGFREYKADMRFCFLFSYPQRIILNIYKRFLISIPYREVRMRTVVSALPSLSLSLEPDTFSLCALSSTISPSSRVWQSVLIPGDFFPVECFISFQNPPERAVLGKPRSFPRGILFPARCRGILYGPYSSLSCTIQIARDDLLIWLLYRS